MWQFWRSEVWTGSYRAKIKMLAKLRSFDRLCQRICSLPFPAAGGCLNHSVQGCMTELYLYYYILLCHFYPPVSLSEDPHDYIGPTWITQDNFSISVALAPSYLQSPFCKFAVTGNRGKPPWFLSQQMWNWEPLTNATCPPSPLGEVG